MSRRKSQTTSGNSSNTFKRAGFKIVRAEYNKNAFGNYVLNVARRSLHISVTRDRNQYILDGPEDELKAADLGRAYNSKQEFVGRLQHWLEARTKS